MEVNIEKYFKRFYPFTNENIKEMHNYLDFRDKDILTVCGSGDLILNMILWGAKRIDTFDINRDCIWYYELKKAGILGLERKEFIEFFCFEDYPVPYQYNKKAFSKKVYNKLVPFLKTEAKEYWDFHFGNIFNSGLNIRSNAKLFMKEPVGYKENIKCNDYLNNDENYCLLREKIRNFDIKFYHVNVTDLNRTLNIKYDYIFLSNISSYMDLLFDKDTLIQFRNLIVGLLPYLKDKGIIQIGYLYNYKLPLYGPYYVENDWTYIHDVMLINSLFDNKHLWCLPVNSVLEYPKNDTDIVMLYKKRVKR